MIQILDIFVSMTENGWLAFLGPNKREVVKREELWKYSFTLVIRASFTLRYIRLKKKYQRQKPRLIKIWRLRTPCKLNHVPRRFRDRDFEVQFGCDIWRLNRATADVKNNHKFPLNNSNHQTFKIQCKNFKENFEKRQGVPLGFYLFLNIFFESMSFEDEIWLSDTKNRTDAYCSISQQRVDLDNVS